MKKNLLYKFLLFVFALFLGTASVSAQCNANFVFNVDAQNHLKYSFSNNSNFNGNIEKFEWKFGNEGKDTANLNPNFTFPQEGEYEVCFMFINDSNCTDTFCTQVFVGNNQGPLCKAEFQMMPDTTQSGLAFSFSSFDGALDTTAQTHSWWVNNQSAGTSKDITYVFPQEGQYDICYAVLTNSGCTDTICQLTTISGNNNNCHAQFKDIQHQGLSFGFEDESTAPNGIQSFQWDMGDGNVYTSSNINHDYNQPGTYNVCLAIQGNQCVDTICRSIVVDSNQSNGGGCHPNFTFVSDTNNANKFSFNDQTTVSDGNIISWEWSFEDGTTEITQNTEHEFPAGNGMYTVCLKIMTDKGCEETSCEMITIGNVSCKAEFSWNPTGVLNEMKFENHSFSDTTITSYEWSMDGTSYTTEFPVHQFSDSGLFDVALIINNATGCTDTTFKQIHINAADTNNHSGNCQASFNFNQNNPDGSSFDFNDNSFADAGISTWNFSTGDGHNYTTPNFVHAYNSDGIYNICLSIQSNDGCNDTVCQTISIVIDTTSNNNNHGGDSLIPIQDCLAAFWASKDTTSPMKYQFKSNSAHANGVALAHNWSINGTSYTTEEVNHEFAAGGEYHITLDVNGAGCQNKVEMQIKVGSTMECAVGYSYVIDTINPNRVQFALSGTEGLTGGFWQFGDGQQAEEKDPIHDFNGPGFYDVCINAYDSASGCQTQTCMPIEIKGATQGGNCFAKFDFTQNKLVLNFKNLSQGDFTEIKYNFGDGASSDMENPTHTYTASGVYNVCVTTFDSITNCVSDYCMPITILADSNDVYCNANFEFFPIGDKKFTFANHSTGNFSEVKWDLNNGLNVMQDYDIEFEFNSAGHHEVCLTIFDTTSGCVSSICKTIEIVDSNFTSCKADFSFFKDAAGGVSFNTEAKGTFTNVHYDMGDGSFNDDIQFSHIFNGPGHYNVCMAIMDTMSGCQDQICKTISIAPDSNQSYCEAKFHGYIDNDGVAHAQNLSIGNYTTEHWDFGDGFSSFDANPTHTFQSSGFYTVCLSILDSVSGCNAKHCEEVNIQLDSNDVNCSADFDFMIIDNEVNFKSTSVGDFTNIHWNFGEGNYSDDMNPSHMYNHTGLMPVCLSIFDSVSGCQANICKDITIIKDTLDAFCVAKFEHMILPNGEIQFNNNSVGNFTHVSWDLGNGSFPHHNDPIGFYTSAGVYQVKIMVWDSINGCQATYTEDVIVSSNTNQPNCHAKFNFFPVSDTLIKFENVSTGNFTNIHWEFGDGKFNELDNEVAHTYTQGGYYNVCVGIFDSITGCHDNYCENIELLLDTTVVDCHAAFEFFPISATEVAFKNESNGQFTNAFWKFGNGIVDHNMNPTIDFTQTGLIGACLTVFDSVSGCQDEFCMEIPLLDDTTTYCEASYGFFVDGNTVKFDPNIKGDITGWVWDFNDGLTSNDSFPSHTFVDAGVYEVCLTVFDSTNGCFNTYCDQISIVDDNAANEYVKANFSYYLNPNDGMVHFQDESVGNPTSWYWDFGDGDSAGVAQNPTYKYIEDGYYEVCLTSKNDNDGQETVCQIISVGDVTDACYAEFNYYANSVTATAHFDNKSLGRITGYEWDFGDSTSSMQYQPSHTYADTGFYAVCLTVTNDSGCVRTFCEEVRVGNALENKCLIGCVWPGDANLDLEANHYDILPMGLHYGETGPARESIDNTWQGHESQDWSAFLWGDVNNKHGDANGDGIIDVADLQVIKTNFAYSHTWQPRAQSTNQLAIDWDADDIDVGETAVLVVSIPDTLNVTMYGLGFEIDLDPTIFDYSTIQYDFSNSWLGSEGSDLITFGLENENLGQIYIAESRNDHNELSGNGELVTITVLAKAKSSTAGAVLTTEGGVTAEGDTVKFSGDEDGANVNNIEERGGYAIKQLVVFPNPTQDLVSFNLPTGQATEYKIEVFDNVGKLIHASLQQNGGTVTTNLKEFNSGIYSIQVTSEKVKYIQKVILTK